jgi:hypothetical protein
VVFRKELVITVKRRDGRVETYRVSVDKNVSGGGGGDLVTYWGFRLISCLFAEAVKGTSVSFSFVDLGGTGRSQVCIATTPGDFLASGCADRSLFIGFGSDSRSPTRSDYKLWGELAKVEASHFVDEANFTFSVVGVWTPNLDVSVCEVGLYMYVCDSGGVARYVLFDRSVLTPCITVSAGSTISVSYVFRF